MDGTMNAQRFLPGPVKRLSPLAVPLAVPVAVPQAVQLAVPCLP